MRRLLVVLSCSLLCEAAVRGDNLLANPDFDSEVTSWVVGCGSTPTWLDEDAAGCPGSGSSHQSAGPCQGFQGAGLGQCIPVQALSTLHASAWFRANEGFGGVLVAFYENLECQEPNVGQELSPMFPSTGVWQPVEFENLSIPPGTVAILLGFGALSPSSTLVVDIDSAYVGEAPLIFRDGFEGDLEGSIAACAWSSTSG